MKDFMDGLFDTNKIPKDLEGGVTIFGERDRRGWWLYCHLSRVSK
jgi:hypothetical protein